MFPSSILKHITKETKKMVRYRHPDHHWSVVRKKIHPIDKALNHFDDFYKQVYDKKWLLIRKALMEKSHKYVAVLNYYGDIEETRTALELQGALNMRTLFNLEKGYIQEQLKQNKHDKYLEQIFKMDKEIENESLEKKEHKSDSNIFDPKEFSLKSSLEKAELDTRRLINTEDVLSTELLHEFIPATKLKGKEDFMLESSHYKMYDQTTEFGVKIEREFDFHFPEHLNIYCFEENNKSYFDPPKRSITGVSNYYVMNGGSVLPVLALDIKPGNKILDLCASPGGKSLLAAQTLYPDVIVSNDVSYSRVNRIKSVYKQFLFDFDEKWLQTGKIRLSNVDGRSMEEGDYFDRILVDVPCTTDRHSLHENDNNIFKPTRIKERLQLPELQRQLLFQALKLVRKGGIVVYSTCSLSPIQNDGVVHMALKQIWEETNMEIVVKDLSPALLQTKSVYKFADKDILRYGHLIIPLVSQNYGPTYFCKLQKIN